MVYGNTLIEFDADLNLAVCIEGDLLQSSVSQLLLICGGRHVSKVVSIQMRRAT